MKSDRTALITGATSGIGAEFSRQLAGQGYNLIITGRRKKEIRDSADEIIKKYKVKVDVIIAELSEQTGRDKVVKAIRKTRDLKFLVNNAGFGYEGYFHEKDFEIHESMLHVHSLAAMKFIYESVPVMLKNGGGTIINVASMSAKIYMPGHSIYNATKAFLVTLTETLHMELRNSNIRLQALCPGFTRTDFHRKMGYGLKDLPDSGLNRWMTPDKVVRYSLKSLEKNRIVCVPGILNRLAWRIPGMIPRKLYYHIMSGFTNLRKVFKPE